MRIAVILPHLELFGGVRRMLEFANRLHARGHDIQILLGESADSTCRWMPVVPPVRILPDGTAERYDVAIHVEETQWWVLQDMPQVTLKVWYALHDGSLYGKPGSWEAAHANVDLRLANSDWTAAQIAKTTPVRPEVQLSGIDGSVFAPVNVPKRYDILWSGDNRPWKGAQTIESACARLGLQPTGMRTLNPPQDRIAEVYAAADVFVVASEFEGFGQPGLEALACGTPLVTTDTGGSREYAKDEVTALVVPPNDRGALADALGRLRGDQALRERLRGNGLDLVHNAFSWDARVEELERRLHRAVDRAHRDDRPVGLGRTPPQTPDLSVVVLAWDQAHHTMRCVDSIRRHTDVPYELIIVDNGSGWSARTYAEHAADRSVLHDQNLGFAKGMNAGLAAAGGRAIAFVNNDTMLPSSWAGPLFESLYERQNVGIVAPAVTEARNDRTRRSVAGVDVEVMNPFEPPPSAVLWVMDRTVAERLGGFDERYEVASGEDVDLAFTVWCNGLDILFDSRVLVDHVGKGTAGTKLPDWRARWRVNGDVFLRRWANAHSSEPANLHRLTDEEFTRNVRTAAAVAGWMQKYFAVRERKFPLRNMVGSMVTPLRRLRTDMVLRHQIKTHPIVASLRRSAARLRWYAHRLPARGRR